MPAQQVRANYPKDADGNLVRPLYVQEVDASGNIVAGNVWAASSLIDGQPQYASVEQASDQRVFNGTSWDRMRGDTNGIAVQPALSVNFWNYAAAASGIVSSTADVSVKAAAGAGVRNYIMSLQLASDALSAVTEIVVKDGATVLFRGKLQTTALPLTTINFEPPLKGSANTAVNVALTASVTGGVYANVQGYTGA